MDATQTEQKLANFFNETLNSLEGTADLVTLNLLIANCIGTFYATTLKPTGWPKMIDMLNEQAMESAKHALNKLENAQKNRP